MVGLYTCWCLIGYLTHPHVAGAQQRGRDLFHLERDLHLPSELTLQRLVLPHPVLGHLVDGYYLYGHVNVLIVLLAWTWLRHRAAFPALRLQVVLLTLSATLVQLVAVAPPRLLPDLGFVDLADRYGESVYGDFGDGMPGQLLAMPSLHVGWAALVAWTVWRNAHGAWRWLGALHLVVMTLVVVAGANHWWLDGVVAVALLAVVIAVVDRLPARLLRRPRHTAAAAPAPIAAASA